LSLCISFSQHSGKYMPMVGIMGFVLLKNTCKYPF
jgi:hypothetical protein